MVTRDVHVDSTFDTPINPLFRNNCLRRSRNWTGVDAESMLLIELLAVFTERQACMFPKPIVCGQD